MTMRRILIMVAVLVGVLVLALVIFIATFDANRYKPELTTLVEQYTGRKLTVAGDLKLSVWPRLALSMGQAALSEADGKGEAARFDSGRVAVALRPLLSRTLVVEGLHLNGLRANFGSAGAAGNVASGPDAAGSASAGGAAAHDGRRWRLENATLETGRIASDEADKLSLDGRLVSPSGDVDLGLELASRYLADFGARTLKLDDLDARLQGSAAGVQNLSARLAANLLADLAAQSAHASSLTIEASAPDGPQLALAGTGKLAIAEGSAELALSGQLDDSKLQLHAAASRLAPLALRYELAADRIDVDRLRERFAAVMKPTPVAPGGPESAPPPASSAPAPGAAAGVAGGAAPPQPASSPLGALAPIANADTQGTLKIEHLQVSGLSFDAMSATSRSGSGQIAIDPLTARVSGGQLQGRASIAAAGPRIVATLTGVDAGALIREATKRDVLEGRGDVQVDLTASGDNHDQWTRSLAGSASFALREGAVRGIDLSRVLQQAQSALGGKVALEDRAKAIERTPFSALTGAFRIAAGVAHTDNLELRASWLHVTGAGEANLNSESLDLLIRATVTSVPGAASENATLRNAVARLEGMTVPVHVSGRFDDLRYKVELKDLAAGAVKRELTRRLGEQLGVPLPGAAPSAPGSPGGKSTDPLDRLRQLLKR